MGLTKTDFTLFADLAGIIAADLRADTRAETELGNRYLISETDLGDGSLMNNGLYANPIEGEEMGLPQLAPDLAYPSSLASLEGYIEITGIDGTAGVVTALSLTGKHSISGLSLYNYANESMTVKLTVDGVVVWDDTFTPASTNGQFLLGMLIAGAASVTSTESTQCNTSFLLELETITANNMTLNYIARPIL